MHTDKIINFTFVYPENDNNTYLVQVDKNKAFGFTCTLFNVEADKEYHLLLELFDEGSYIGNVGFSINTTSDFMIPISEDEDLYSCGCTITDDRLKDMIADLNTGTYESRLYLLSEEDIILDKTVSYFNV